jgi:hypothetical protein
MGSGGGGGGGGGSGSDTTGHITSDTTWTGTMTVSATTTIDPGVTLTIAAGTTVNVAASAQIVVLGTLDAQGTSGNEITIQPDGGAAHFGLGETGIQVGLTPTDAGTLKLAHTTVTGNGIMLHGTSSMVATDTRMSRSNGDFLVLNDQGSIDVSYSEIGLEPAEGTDTTHCDMHFNAGTTIKFTHSNVTSSYYGIMFYGGTNADFTSNNWYGNLTTNVDATLGQVSGDFSNSYFDKNPPPTAAGLTQNNLSATRLLACDGTNDATCAGPRP